MTSVATLTDEILRAGLADWVPLRAVDGLARRVGCQSEDAARALVFSALSQLANDGLIEFGEVSDGGFFEWSSSVSDSLFRIEKVWETMDRDHWGFAAWIKNTPAGDAKARKDV